ncbi:hypothetical protein LCGC14_1423780 [marine sediment metagenome]|uniref:YopX protein domain-containing protein n=1 Tax=marine sediment metagenome TaxID=412755 RepID=A0A0F9M616_9ZZZZ
MREIKFKARDIDLGEWKTFEDLGHIAVYTPFEIREQFEHWRQYTGLKDKNGVEIYGGDILCLGQSEPGVVTWCDWATGFAWVHPGIDPDDIDMSMDGVGTFEAKQLEVIGNIWEHPELLEEAKT